MIKGTCFTPGAFEKGENVQPGEEVAQGDLTNGWKYLVGGNQEEAARLFSVVPTERTRGNGDKLKNMTFHLLSLTPLEQRDWTC